jgi:hypothetical protein
MRKIARRVRQAIFVGGMGLEPTFTKVITMSKLETKLETGLETLVTRFKSVWINFKP